MDYELGLRTLKSHLPASTLEEYLLYEARLRENLHRERLFGSTETTRAERAGVVHTLNRLAQTHLGISFNELCQPSSPPEASPERQVIIDPQDLYTVLVQKFDLEELRTLCFTLSVDYDTLRGEGKAGKVRELVMHLQRRDELTQLAAAIRRERGDVI